MVTLPNRGWQFTPVPHPSTLARIYTILCVKLFGGTSREAVDLFVRGGGLPVAPAAPSTDQPLPRFQPRFTRMTECVLSTSERRNSSRIRRNPPSVRSPMIRDGLCSIPKKADGRNASEAIRSRAHVRKAEVSRYSVEEIKHGLRLACLRFLSSSG